MTGVQTCALPICQKKLKQMFLDDWFSLTAQQIKKFYPKINVECWCPEKTYKNPKEFMSSKIKYRQFPVTFSPMYALDLSISMLKELKKEAEKAKKENYKLIIHLHEYHNLHGLLISTFFKNQKIVAQHHGGSWPLKHLRQTKRYKPFFPLFILGQIWENLVIKNISCFYALSQDEIDYLKRKAPNSSVRFQTMGIEDFYYKSIKKNVARKKLKWPLDKKIILFLGRVNYVKGVNYLVDAMGKLKDVELKIIGWGEQLEELKDYTKSKRLTNVEFLGPIFGRKKIDYMSAVDAFVLPSTKEGASVSTMEALAQNLPSVVTDVGGMALMVQNGKEGIVVKPKDSEKIVNAIREILKWKGRNIRQHAQKYRWKKIIENTVKDYLNH